MTNIGQRNLDASVQKTIELLSDIEKEMNWQGRRDQSYAALRKVLHVFRDRLPVDKAVNFAAQLPLLTRGVFFDGWNPEDVPVKMDKQEFENKVQEDFNYSVEGGVQRVIEVVFDKLFKDISKGEVEDLKDSLPEGIRELM